MSDILIDIITRRKKRKMAEAALKSLTDVVTGLQQKVELKATIQKISPHDFGHTSVSFAGNHLEDSKAFLSRFNELALLKSLNDADKFKAFLRYLAAHTSGFQPACRVYFPPHPVRYEPVSTYLGPHSRRTTVPLCDTSQA